MLNEEKIKIAESNVRKYLADGDLKKRDPDINIIKAFKINSEESLTVADLLFQKDISPLWVIVSSYYAMFYIANAILLKIGYKVGDHSPHKVTSDALIVFVRNKIKTQLLEDYDDAKAEAIGLEIIGSLEQERIKRSNFQYEMGYEVKQSKSKTSLERAKRFVFEIEKLIEDME